MSLAKGLEWSYKDHLFRGYSIAGQTTSLLYNNAKICFDIAQGLPWQIGAKLYCITHMHADHGAGLPYLLSQRSLFRQPDVPILLPEEQLPAVDNIIKAWMEIEGFEFAYHLIPAHEGLRYDFQDKYQIRPFRTTHRVTSFGYLVYEKKKKLKAHWVGADRTAIIKAKEKGEVLEEEVYSPLMAFTGDTQIEFLDAHPDIKKSELLFMETTYINEKKSIEETRKWGHIHLDEFLPRLHEMQNKKICLIHLSARYQSEEANKILQEKLPQEFGQRIELFPRPF